MRTLRLVATFCTLLAMPLCVHAQVDERASLPRREPAVIRQPNILVVIADDVGVDSLSLYGTGFDSACSTGRNECSTAEECTAGETCDANMPPTPVIEGLAATGVLFRNVWAYPTCSPTRAAASTGRYGFRTGVGFAGTPLPLSETTIPKALDAQPGSIYAHAAIGKWHLGGGVTGPNAHGYSHFAGTLDNITNYFNWPRVVDGVQAPSTTYATTANVDDALDWINRQATPWFLWLAFNAPHSTFHAPPDRLHSYHGVTRPNLPVPARQSCAGRPARQLRLCYSAMLEALDTELGRLLDSLPPDTRANTTIIFMGDNGTPTEVTAPPSDPAHAKFTIYDGGVHVPLIISGANVVNPNRESTGLVSITDVFATVLRLAGIRDPSTVVAADAEIDSVSLWPIIRDRRHKVRAHVFSEQFHPMPSLDDGQVIRNARGYKLLRFANRTSNALEFYDLEADPFETHNLYDEAGPALDREQRRNFRDLCFRLNLLTGLAVNCATRQ